MGARLRSWITGLVAGAWLSFARARAGFELADLPGVEADTAARVRALALALLALALARRAPRSAGPDGGAVQPAWLLAGACLGFAAHAAVGDGWFLAASWGRVGVGLLVVYLMLRFALGVERSDLHPDAAPVREERSGRLALLGFGAAAAGATQALEATARPLRLLGDGTPLGEAELALPMMLATLLGAGAFGPWLAGRGRHPLLLAVGLAAVPCACLHGLAFLARVSEAQTIDGPNAYLDFLGHYRLGPLDFATPQAHLLLGARTFLIPGFVLGAALGGVRRRSELGAVLAGAALGVLATPALVAVTPAEGADLVAARPLFRVQLAALLAAGGAGIALATLPGDARLARLARAAAAVAVVAVALGAWALPGGAPLPLSPWSQWPVDPSFVTETPAGVVTIESRAGEGEVVTLDGRCLTPREPEAVADVQQIEVAVGAEDGPLSARLMQQGRVLLIGQLTPARRLALVRCGARIIDRTGSWWQAMEAVERRLFVGEEPPPGDVLSPAEARRRLRSAARPYALVVAPAVDGAAPDLESVLAFDLDTPIVAWVRGRTDLAGRDLGTAVLLGGAMIENLAVGALGGGRAELGDAVDPGPPAARTLPILRQSADPFARRIGYLEDTALRLAAAPDAHPFVLGLARFATVQRRSSPLVREALAVEVSDAGLALVRDELLARPPGAPIAPWERHLVEAWAETLAGKRDVERVSSFVEPLAARVREIDQPWPVLERVLAEADWELLDFERCAARLAELVRAAPSDQELRRWLARALVHAGRPAEAARELETLVRQRPDDEELRRSWAIALLRAGDQRGVDLARALLVEHPEDALLRAHLEPGPPPPLDPEPTLRPGLTHH